MSTVNIFRLFQFILVKDVSQDIRLFNKKYYRKIANKRYRPITC
ncbi:unnamed protein product [Tenebrio molitor]|nr:unnamed protein product [Tenebrio molitor]